MNRIIVVLLFVFTAIVGKAEIENQLLDSAVVYYTSGNYEKAIVSYETVLANGFQAAELYYNLGNAYYKSNKIPMAIVNYERALKITNDHDDIEFNLKLANLHVVDKIEIIPEFFMTSWRNDLISLLDSNSWAYISMGAFVLCLVLLITFFLSSQAIFRKIAFWLGLIFLVGSLLSFSYSRKLKWVAEKEPEAVVVTPSVVVKSSPDESGTELFLIHEGLKIKVTDRLGEWREVRLSDGNKGWLKSIDLVVI